MASLLTRKIGGRTRYDVQLTDLDGRRRTLRLGTDKRSAEQFAGKLESIRASRLAGGGLDKPVAEWVRDLPQPTYDRVVGIGLLDPRASIPTLGEWAERFIEIRSHDVKPATIRAYRLTISKLSGHFDTRRRVDQITKAEAANWRTELQDSKIAEATVRQHTRNAKAIFELLVKREVITANPFSGLPSAAIAGKPDYLNEADADRVLACLPDSRWRLLFGLARFAGLRTPSETHALTWGDIDFERGRMRVYAPKRHHRHGTASEATRTIPIFPRVRELLEARRSDIRHSVFPTDQVVGLSSNNLHRTIREAMRRAEIEPWGRLFQTLRQSAAVDLAAGGLPQFIHAQWMGHGIEVSARYYLSVPDEVFDRVAETYAKGGVMHPVMQKGAESPGNGRKLVTAEPVTLQS